MKPREVNKNLIASVRAAVNGELWRLERDLGVSRTTPGFTELVDKIIAHAALSLGRGDGSLSVVQKLIDDWKPKKRKTRIRKHGS